jgi:Tol biopolymer transport system component/tRNA A-37 threonylcarbamoyl transferase component Bud32
MTHTLQAGDVAAERFKIARFIAEGGMGEVYEAEDQVLGGRVALKFLSRHSMENPRILRRFRREVQLARQVTHSNVCRLFDVYQHKLDRGGREMDAVFVTMELLDGETLDEYLQQHGPLTEDEALGILKQITKALDAAHTANVIHRDLKPSNIMLVPSEDGERRVVVTDFGLARSTSAKATRTTPLTGELRLVGTADYMAPEQLRGENVTTACDVYALGVVIYQMVTGRKPYEANNALSLLTKRATEAPAPPQQYRPDLDENWSAVILACLENAADKRPPTAGDVAALLGAESTELTRTIVTLQGWPAPGQTAPGQTAPGLAAPASPNRSRTAAWVSALLIVLVLGLTAGFLLRPPPPPPPPSYGESVQLTTATGLELDPSLSADGAAVAYTSDRTGAFEIFVRDLGPGGQERQLTTDGTQNFEPSFSPDGEWIAYHSLDRSGIWAVPASGGAPRRLTSEGSRPSFSPDGEWIAYQTQSNPQLSETSIAAIGASNLRLVRVDGSSGRELTRRGAPPGAHGAPTFSPDGLWVAFSASDRSASELWAIRVDLRSGEPGELVRLLGGSQQGSTIMAYDPSYSADGRFLYFSGRRREVHDLLALPLEDGRPTGDVVPISHGLTSFRHVTVSGDGKRMAYTAIATRSNLHSLPISAAGEAAGEPRALTSGNSRNSRPAFSADGGRLSYDHWTLGSTVGIWVMDADGTNPVQITLEQAIATISSWFPDGRVGYLLRRQGVMRVVDPAAPGEFSAVTPLDEDVGWARISPDGGRLAFHSKGDGLSLQVYVLDLATGRRRQLTRGKAMTAFPCWSADGRWLTVQAEKGGSRHVMVLPADPAPGTRGEAEELTTGAGQNWAYSFSPDSDKVVFAANRGGFWNVWWVSRSTGEEKQLTDYRLLHGYVRYPAWSPAGDQIVYELAETTGDIWVSRRSSPDED